MILRCEVIMNKTIKPVSCLKCPAIKETKKTYKCDVAQWEVKKEDKWEQYKKWNNCPIDWDE